MTSHPALVLAASSTEVTASSAVLITAALIGIAVVILLITVLKFNPFIALTLGSAVVAAVAGVEPVGLLTSFTAGFGGTLGGIAPLIALGAVIGTVLVQSGGANTLVDKVLSTSSPKLLPWAVALVAFIIGIPLFFEIGVVLLVPIIMLIARRSKVPVLLVGMPMLVALGQLHSLLPPHPGPLALVAALNADLGLTMLFGFALAIPMTILFGPVLAPVYARLAPVYAPALASDDATGGLAEGTPGARRPALGWALLTMLMPVALMLLKAVVDIFAPEGALADVVDFIGSPLTALIIATLLAIITLGYGTGRSLQTVSNMVGSSFASVAGVILIVGAGGGFKQTLVDLGIGDVVAQGAIALSLSPVLVGWLLAAVIRVATGSSTVSALTAAGLALPLVQGLDAPHVALMVLVIGVGSGFGSHVNDAGFWLIKEFFGLTVGQTFKTWSLMSVIAPLVALGLISIVWAIAP
jgi:GntP family gluconate:H+ symporter